MDHDELKKIRIEIDRTNRSLISLFERRMELVRSVAEYKRERGLPVYDAAREKEVIEQCSGWVRDPEYRGGCLWLIQPPGAARLFLRTGGQRIQLQALWRRCRRRRRRRGGLRRAADREFVHRGDT